MEISIVMLVLTWIPWEKLNSIASVHHIKRFSKIRNVSQITSRNGWQKNEKHNNESNYKAFCASRKKNTKTKTKTKKWQAFTKRETFSFCYFQKLLRVKSKQKQMKVSNKSIYWICKQRYECITCIMLTR